MNTPDSIPAQEPESKTKSGVKEKHPAAVVQAARAFAGPDSMAMNSVFPNATLAVRQPEIGLESRMFNTSRQALNSTGKGQIRRIFT